jgi:hypothetical protein
MSNEDSDGPGQLTRGSLRALIKETINELYDERIAESIKREVGDDYVSVANSVMREIRELSDTREALEAQNHQIIDKTINLDQKSTHIGAVETYPHDQVPQSLIDIVRNINQRK